MLIEFYSQRAKEIYETPTSIFVTSTLALALFFRKVVVTSTPTRSRMQTVTPGLHASMVPSDVAGENIFPSSGEGNAESSIF